MTLLRDVFDALVRCVPLALSVIFTLIATVVLIAVAIITREANLWAVLAVLAAIGINGFALGMEVGAERESRY